MNRRTDIDALRGLMLILMTITHVPTRYSQWLSQPFGFVSSAEGFVFLSAYLVGAVYTARATRDGVWAMCGALWRRARLVWVCQIATLIFLFTLIAEISLHTDQASIRNLLSFYLADPVDALWASALMLYNPPLLDILPMYLMFMLASPVLLAAGLRRNGWLLIIIASIALWTLAQFGVLHALYNGVVSTTQWKIPLNQTGAFELAAWQLIWVLGMWLGARHATGSERTPVPSWALAAAVTFAIVCVVWRHAVGQNPFGEGAAFNVLFDKWRLGPLRLVDFFALTVVVMRFGPHLAAHVDLRPLASLGRASLPVFCAHIVAVLLVLSVAGDVAGKAPLWAETGLLLAILLALVATAQLSNLFGRTTRGPRLPRRLEAGAAV
jgi:hypothetical protein